MQDQVREHAKRIADAKLEADRASIETARVQEQVKQLDAQRKEVARLAQLREQIEKHIADLEQKLSEKRKEFARVVDDFAALDSQRSDLSRRVRELEGQRSELSPPPIKAAAPARPAAAR